MNAREKSEIANLSINEKMQLYHYVCDQLERLEPYRQLHGISDGCGLDSVVASAISHIGDD